MDAWRGYATICRLCLRKDGFMFGIFNHNNGKEKSLYEKIVDCTALQITINDGLPNVICHRCLYKIEFCLEFRQQCFISDATLKRINTTDNENDPDACIPIPEPPLNFYDPGTSDVVMVIDPTSLDYNSDIEVDNVASIDNDNRTIKNGYGFSNISMCRYCDHAFMNKEECNAHEKIAHNSEKPYSCTSCNVDFEDRMHYFTHMKNVHQDDKPFKCPQCSRTFARRSDLRKHTIVHTGIKPFTCKVCFKSFSRNTNLSKHMRIHSGHKLFSCKKCHKKFLSKADLAKHSVYHSKVKNKKTQSQKKDNNSEIVENKPDTDSKILDYNNGEFDNKTIDSGNNDENPSENMVISIDPFSQDNFHVKDDDQLSNSSKISDINTDYQRIMSGLAQQESSYLNKINEESVKSRPFVCNTCNKTFVRKRELDRHLVTHTGMKPFKCTKCDKSFGRKDKLIRHMRIHDVDKQFSCEICEETFNRRESFIQHKKVYHADPESEMLQA